MFIFALAIAFHTLAAAIWVGGMFFAYMALRPALAELAVEERLAVWRRVLPKFFRWVWLVIAVLLATGYGALMGYRGGFVGAGFHVNLMQLTGLIMVGLYLYLFFVPWWIFKRSLAAGDLEKATGALERIRKIIQINLALGLLTIAVAASGSYWGH